MPEDSISIRLQIRTAEVRRELEEVISSIKGFYLQSPGFSGPCDLIIVEVDGGTEEFSPLENIRSTGMAGEIFVTSRNTNSSVLIEALRAGIKEFLPQPLKKEEVGRALIRMSERSQKVSLTETRARQGKIVHVFGGKGGVGTTTVAVNLATSLMELEGVKSVALLDMNLLFGEVPLFLGIEPAFDWVEVAKNISRLDVTYLMSSLSKHSSGVYVLPSPAKLSEDPSVNPGVIETLLRMMSNFFDFIIIDGGQSLDENAKRLLKISDTVLLVIVLSLPCLVNLKRVLSSLNTLGYPAQENIQIVVNRVQKKSLITMADAEDSVKKKFLLGIPNDFQTTMSAINQGKPISALDYGSDLCKKFRELASYISGKSERKRKSLFGLSWKSNEDVGTI